MTQDVIQKIYLVFTATPIDAAEMASIKKLNEIDENKSTEFHDYVSVYEKYWHKNDTKQDNI